MSMAGWVIDRPNREFTLSALDPATSRSAVLDPSPLSGHTVRELKDGMKWKGGRVRLYSPGELRRNAAGGRFEST
jgi:hypothetical protein